MSPIIEDDVLNRKSLSSTYRNYKKDTEYIAGWLACTSKQCVYTRADPEPEPQQQAPRKRGKARKTTKQAPKVDAKVQYAIQIAEFVKMAQPIVSFKP
jgi:hypothetical protein